MSLSKDTNYIVSGLERSGTSLMMQILKVSGIPISYDINKKEDIHNPNGYYELSNGKIIDDLMKLEYREIYGNKGKFIKVTAYGIKYLPKDCKFEVIFMDRNVDEIIESMEKKSMNKYDYEKSRDLLLKLRNFTLKYLRDNKIPYMIISYNGLVNENSDKMDLHLLKQKYDVDVEKALKVIDRRLYRNRK